MKKRQPTLWPQKVMRKYLKPKEPVTEKDIVYGNVRDIFILMKKQQAVELAQIQSALGRSKTWRDLARNLPEETFEEIIREMLDSEDLLELVTSDCNWEEYWESLQDREPEERLARILETLKEAGEEGEPKGCRLPSHLDLGDKFVKELLPGYDFFRYCWDVEDMHRLVPQEIQENFGRVVATVHDGWFLELDETRKEEIIAILEEKYGYRCKEGAGLISLTMS